MQNTSEPRKRKTTGRCTKDILGERGSKDDERNSPNCTDIDPTDARASVISFIGKESKSDASTAEGCGDSGNEFQHKKFRSKKGKTNAGKC